MENKPGSPEALEFGVLEAENHLPEQARGGPAILLLKIVIVLWMLSYVTITILFLAQNWLQGYQPACDVFRATDCAARAPLFVSALHAVLGGVLGAGALGLVSFHKHVSAQSDFDPAHSWGYFVAPWLAGVLGLIVFALLQTGLLVFSGSVGPSDDAILSNLAFLAVGFLSGFGWYDATERIRSVVKQFFEEPQRRPARGEEAPETTTGPGEESVAPEAPAEDDEV